MSNENHARLRVDVPDTQKTQLHQAILTLVTVLLSIALTLASQVVSQGLGITEPAADPMLTLGTSHFSNIEADTFTGALTGNVTGNVTGNLTAALNTQNNGIPSVIASNIAYGTLTGTIATIPDGDVWIVHDVFVRTTTSFACTGDNCALTIGDGNDADGFIAAVDAGLQSTFTEATGYPAGWYGLENGSNGAYTVDDGAFAYAPSGAAETIDYAITGTSPAAGAATVYVIYTRIP